MSQTLFVSDLHLDNKRPQIIATFCRFLQTLKDTDALYILGDLFEYWIGDDNPDVGLKKVSESLREASTAGISVYFIHGNRDFLVGQQFAKFTQCKLLPEETVIDLYGTPTLIMHGDTLCTDDIAYQRYRTIIRNKWVQKTLLLLSTKQRVKFAERLRDTSKSATKDKQPEIMDVNQDTVETKLLHHDVQTLIHGHTHRPAIHEFVYNGTACKRIVLGDWYDQGSLLRCTPNSMELETLPA